MSLRHWRHSCAREATRIREKCERFTENSRFLSRVKAGAVSLVSGGTSRVVRLKIGDVRGSKVVSPAAFPADGLFRAEEGGTRVSKARSYVALGAVYQSPWDERVQTHGKGWAPRGSVSGEVGECFT